MNVKLFTHTATKAFRLSLSPAPMAHAATITVNSTADNANAGGGNCIIVDDSHLLLQILQGG